MVSKHDKLIDILAQDTRDCIFKWKNTEYGYDHKVLGEVDYMMLHKDILSLFEVKSSANPFLERKARGQLNRAEKYIPDILRDEGHYINKVQKFYVHGIPKGYDYKMRFMK